MKHRLIWLQGGPVSHHWTIPLIGESSEHNFRHVERDISCLRKLFQGILVLYIKSKRLGSQEILFQSAQWQWAVLQQLNVQCLLCWLHTCTCHFKVWLMWQWNSKCMWKVCFVIFFFTVRTICFLKKLRGLSAFMLEKLIFEQSFHQILCLLHQSKIHLMFTNPFYIIQLISLSG